MNRCTTRSAALVVGDAAVLLGLRPRWAWVATGVRHPDGWLRTAGPDVAVAAGCAVLLWLAAAWVAVGLLAGLGARLPGLAGRACARLARVVLPRVLVRVVVGGTGLGLLAAPAAQAMTPAGAAAPARPVSAVAVSSTTGVPSPTWPVSPGASAPTRPPAPAQLPAPAPPTSSTPAPTPHRPAHPTTAADHARVRAGDSLWLLAGQRLGPHAGAADIAHYWPQVYAANRGVIGADPAVIHPGQVLDLPTPTQEPSP